MFTGLVEEIGQVMGIKNGENSSKITISSRKVLEEVKLGDSIAVNGACLTVTSFTGNSFTVDVMAETLRKSNLKLLKRNSSVNLERAVMIGERLGGHIVTGHIDGICKVKDIKKEDIATWLIIKPPLELLKYMVSKGSISLDGVSLTIAEVYEDCISVSLIPHTKAQTILQYKSVGDEINVECDLIGKYIENFILRREKKPSKNSNITEELLKENGFF
ncbi:riboflavin synthase [Clostridium sp. BJN0013]|uniref:riboflavin synthase n=1 Tax=Clostridium sp. BJN0013 TaxID=3236840 RepID=UPI0034C63E6F